MTDGVVGASLRLQFADEAIRGLDFLPLFEVCLEPIELGDLAAEGL
jgi:hypothetical protein